MSQSAGIRQRKQVMPPREESPPIDIEMLGEAPSAVPRRLPARHAKLNVKTYADDDYDPQIDRRVDEGKASDGVSETELRRCDPSGNHITYTVEGAEPMTGGPTTAYVVEEGGGVASHNDVATLLYTAGPGQVTIHSDAPGEAHYTVGGPADQLLSNTYVYTPDNVTVNGGFATSYNYPTSNQYGPGSYIMSPVGHTASSIACTRSPNSTPDDDANGINPTARASPATIQWLLNNYETAEGVSLPRCTLYNHYQSHCRDHKLDPVNAASFGKLIRSVFLGLRTRRLGTRGNSKYHYYGIRIRQQSHLNMNPDPRGPAIDLGGQNSPMIGHRPPQLTNTSSSSNRRGRRAPQPPPVAAIVEYDRPASVAETTVSPTPTVDTVHGGEAQATLDNGVETYASFLGEGVVPSIVTPIKDGIEELLPPLGLTVAHAVKFVQAYNQQCVNVLEAIRQLDTSEVPEYWRTFWQPEADFEEESGMELTQEQIFALCQVPQITAYMEEMDSRFYQVIVDVFIPNVLKKLPPQLITIIRSFAKNLESGLQISMQGAPEAILQMKMRSVRSLAQTLRRYTSLNHLAEAARQVLVSETQMSQMVTDLSRVDFEHINEQAAWVAHCSPIFVDQLQRTFRENLSAKLPLEKWAEWLEAVVDQVLAQYHDKPVAQLVHAAKQFLLKWSLYSSFIIRDITLRSAPSFGSFHLIRLLYDEFMFYLVEQRLGKWQSMTTIAVMTVMADEPDDPATSSVFESPNGGHSSSVPHVDKTPRTPTTTNENGKRPLEHRENQEDVAEKMPKMEGGIIKSSH